MYVVKPELQIQPQNKDHPVSEGHTSITLPC